MNAASREPAKSHAREVVITRVLNADRERVFNAWMEPKSMKHWWGPKGFTTPVCMMDARVGGKYLYCLQSPDGEDVWSKGTFREITPPRRLVITDSFADKEGNTVPASQYGMSRNWPLEMPVTVTFEELGQRTKITLRHSGVGGVSPSERDNVRQGWDETLEKFDNYLTKSRRTHEAAGSRHQEAKEGAG